MTDSSPPDATPVDAGDTGVKARALTRLRALRQALLKVLPQQDAAVDGLLASLLAGGHLLLEGPTGSGKTLLTAPWRPAWMPVSPGCTAIRP